METIQNSIPKRPGLLTVLCILTFIYSGLKIMGSFFGMIFSSVSDSFDLGLFDDALEQIDEEFLRPFVEKAFEVAQKGIEHAFAISLSNLILYSVSLLGAIFMFQLKRKGFYLYTAAQVLILLISPIFLGWNFITAFDILVSGMFTALFIILYALNLKHMR